MTNAANTDAIAKATGITWQDWVSVVEAAGGAANSHVDLAALAEQHLGTIGGSATNNDAWWAQSIAVAYEQHIGRRVPGQNCSGDFQVGVSKTFTGTMDEALNAWRDHTAGMAAFGGVPVEQDPAVSATPTWRYWRVKLADGSRVSLDIHQKNPGKVGMGINHTKLGSKEEAERWRGVWKSIFSKL